MRWNCLKDKCQRISTWLNQDIHPLYLRIKDEQLQEQYQSNYRQTIRLRVRVITIILFLFFIIVCLREREQLENQTQFFVQFGSILMSLTVMVILSSIKLSLIDYSVLWLILIRCLVTWIIFKYKLEGAPSFSVIDIKEMQDSIVFVFVPSFVCFSISWRLDFYATTPIALIATFLTTSSAYSDENGNMDCYA